ncbi:unnamed protein product [Prorocentrum cordatum]|uniref:Uncharacterized protein n=1 Tax=Prorocentrum cordatum TaxID=2364126 RepID=A0ABN9UEH6_9DINO|nr:unnamed protein product [Polarella glacialis]
MGGPPMMVGPGGKGKGKPGITIVNPPFQQKGAQQWGKGGGGGWGKDNSAWGKGSWGKDSWGKDSWAARTPGARARARTKESHGGRAAQACRASGSRRRL